MDYEALIRPALACIATGTICYTIGSLRGRFGTKPERIRKTSEGNVVVSLGPQSLDGKLRDFLFIANGNQWYREDYSRDAMHGSFTYSAPPTDDTKR